ncbi:hypothetical protein HN51_046028 [Arachis hypogaea]|uniref:uncharacterized protein n=1 Tax=Arachis hypogaea TaxID=3818 RepID=UPI0007AF9DBA|nr:uncharacterized protein LOC107612896 isoform X1 [Arachis ipaensis]XP_025669603.1 uncharacterized protein LOC112769331 isoform X1 [Arachis hypogaea]QHN98301.1 uncharacterized protein DS421_18g634820 [Arachis hypogaea]
MATAAFKSTTKRTPVGAGASASSAEDTASSNRSGGSSTSLHHRRSRSLSRFSRSLTSHENNDSNSSNSNGNGYDFSAPRRGKFVNTVRGSGFPEISLDDLAIEFFESANRGRSSGSGRFDSEATPAASQRRGRSVSRKGSGAGDDRRISIGGGGGGGRTVADANNPRRRRSVSVVRYQISDSESDLDHSQKSRSRVSMKNTDNGNKLMNKSVASDQRPSLKKSLSQKDLRPFDGYSSHSSVLTDDEGAGVHFNKNGSEKQVVYPQKKVADSVRDNGSHKVTQKEIRHLGIEQAVAKPRGVQSVSLARRNYESELEQSQKRKQELLAEIVFEEQRGKELSKIVNELVPATKNNSAQKPSRARKRSNDRSRMSMCLTEEAERYIEDFISNVEDTTDISSLDGERSDTSSSIGGLIKPETYSSPPIPRSIPGLTDGVTLPWLQWETSNDVSHAASLNIAQMTLTPKSASSTQEISKAQDQSSYSVSSRGSWSPECLREYIGKDVYSKFGESYSYSDKSFSATSKGLRYDMDEYLKAKSKEDIIIERWRQQHRINSGSLVLCNLRLF